MTDIGARLRVLLTEDNTEHFGTLVRREPLEAEEDDGSIWTLSEDHPVIQLDDGREVLGIDCFWTEASS